VKTDPVVPEYGNGPITSSSIPFHGFDFGNQGGNGLGFGVFGDYGGEQ
jgi:hypothetical protein